MPFSREIGRALGMIDWVTPAKMGSITNNTVSTLRLVAKTTDNSNLRYQLVSNVTDTNLPLNLTLSDTGEIMGRVAHQPTSEFTTPVITSSFTFTVTATSSTPNMPPATRTFTLNVESVFDEPVDTVYVEAALNAEDNDRIRSLIDPTLNATLIPPEYLYRPTDPRFGLTKRLIYDHAYGIAASTVTEYTAAIAKNHYRRRVTLGPLKWATAKNDAGTPIYEVVYSEIIDDLMNPVNKSVSSTIRWAQPINLGPYFITTNELFTTGAYSGTPNLSLYTSLTYRTQRYVYPNSLQNMRTKITSELGQIVDYRLLPRWMISPQADGTVLGYTAAWVICHTLPDKGHAEKIVTNINTQWPHKLNEIDFVLDRITVDKESTYSYSLNLTTHSWLQLPGAIDDHPAAKNPDFDVMFPQKHIIKRWLD